MNYVFGLRSKAAHSHSPYIIPLFCLFVNMILKRKSHFLAKKATFAGTPAFLRKISLSCRKTEPDLPEGEPFRLPVFIPDGEPEFPVYVLGQSGADVIAPKDLHGGAQEEAPTSIVPEKGSRFFGEPVKERKKTGKKGRRQPGADKSEAKRS